MFVWKYASCLKKGIAHQKSNTECQDGIATYEDDNCIVAALADGLGSLKNSEVAAKSATQSVCKIFSKVKRMKLRPTDLDERFKTVLVDKITENALKKSAEMGIDQSTMDCTIVFVYISKLYDYAVTGRLGDSAVCVIKKTDSIVLGDSNASACGTSAIFDKDANLNIDISYWDVKAEEIYGFILSSDGLDNEIYVKGSPRVNRAAEGYFNAVSVSEEPEKVIQDKISELTSFEDTPFDDDISIFVISRITENIEFEKDPTWLCTCGERNRLQDTYCYKCNKDFSVLYQNVSFREHGGKTNFFLEINKHPEEELKIIGLQQEEKTSEKGDSPEPSPSDEANPGEKSAAAPNNEEKKACPLPAPGSNCKGAEEKREEASADDTANEKCATEILKADNSADDKGKEPPVVDGVSKGILDRLKTMMNPKSGNP